MIQADMHIHTSFTDSEAVHAIWRMRQSEKG